MRPRLRDECVVHAGSCSRGLRSRARPPGPTGDPARVAEKQAPAFVRGVRWSLLQRVYQDREHRPIWVRGTRPDGRARELVRRICRSGEEGLRPGDYDLAGLRAALEKLKDGEGRPDPAALAALDLRLTSLMLGFGTDLLVGPPRPAHGGRRLVSHPRRSSVDSTLRAALADDDSPDVLDSLRPKQKEYDELVRCAAGVPRDPAEGRLGNGSGRQGARGGRQGRAGGGAPPAAPRHRRSRLGQATPTCSTARSPAPSRGSGCGMVFRATASPTGRPIGAMNVPVEDRIRQIEINLDRYRWLPAELTERYVLVNIPDFTSTPTTTGSTEFEQRVIVGDQYQNATPVFADSMTYLVFRPEWNVPPGILAREILPRLQDDDDYDLAAQGLEVVDSTGKVVKDPSEIDWDDVDTADTALPHPAEAGADQRARPGEVHVPEPVQHLPARHAEPEAVRAGAPDAEPRMRAGAGPGAAAAFALDGQDGLERGKIEEAMDDSAKGNRMVSLKEPLPVYLLYLTAFVRDGQVQFRNDPYGKDRRAMGRIAAPEWRRRPCARRSTGCSAGDLREAATSLPSRRAAAASAAPPPARSPAAPPLPASA